MVVLYIHLFFIQQCTSVLSITWRVKKKVYTIVFHGCIQMCIFKEKYFLLCLNSTISWIEHKVAYE